MSYLRGFLRQAEHISVNETPTESAAETSKDTTSPG